MVLNGLEDGTITVGQAALKCLKIARLMNDEEAMLWLRNETGGYPGKRPKELFNIAFNRGRGYYEETKPFIFTQTADELESSIASYQEAIKSFTTAGISVSGQYSNAAMFTLTDSVSRSTNRHLNQIILAQKRLNILRGNYYDYALTIYNQLAFAGQVEELFRNYRAEVDKSLAATIPESIQRFKTVYDSLKSNEPESWSQAVLTCRRLIKGLADELYKHPIDQPFTTKSGKKLDVSGDKYKNRLFAFIDEKEKSSTKLRLTISTIDYIVSYVEDLNELINKGIHDESPLTYEEARMAVIHTYLLMGDIILSCNLSE